MSRILERVAAFFKRRCKHNGRVVADITEGESGIAWCQTCGAICRSPGTWELAIDPRLGGPTSTAPGGGSRRPVRFRLRNLTSAATRGRIHSTAAGLASARPRRRPPAPLVSHPSQPRLDGRG